MLNYLTVLTGIGRQDSMRPALLFGFAYCHVLTVVRAGHYD